MSKKKPNYYVDKQDLSDRLVAHNKAVKKAEETGSEPPRVPEDIGRDIFNICHRFSFSPGFINYPFREDMVMEAVENCLKYLHNYDPVKSKSGKPEPLSYFTQFAYFAFLQRIKREKKQYHTKAKYVQSNAMHLDILSQDDSELAQDFGSVYYKFVQTLYDVELGEFDSPAKKKKPEKETPLEKFEE